MAELLLFLATAALAWLVGVIVGGAAMRAKMIEDKQFVDRGVLYTVRPALPNQQPPPRGFSEASK